MRHGWMRASFLVVCFVAAAIAGYWVSGEFGAEALRREAQSQLSTLLKGSVRIARARLVIRGGLFLEGERVGVYPRDTVPHRPALFASRVSAELDVLALLTGRFRLNGLLLDDAVLEIRRSSDGHWSPPPLQWLVDRGTEPSAPNLERTLDWMNGLEVVARTLLGSPLVARRVELRRGRITWYDEAAGGQSGPVQTGLYSVEGRLVHHWLSGDAELRLRAALVGRDHAPVALRLEGWQRGGDDMRLALTADRLPLDYLGPYVASSGADARFDGRWSGEIAYETHAAAHGIVTVESVLEDFAASLSVRDGRFSFARPVVGLTAALEIHPGRVRLAEGHFDAEGIAISLAGSVERPLGPAARARLEIDVGGLALEEVREIARSLPDEDGETLETVLSRIDDGRIERIGARGTARIDQWATLVVGEADRLPRGFVLSASVADVEIPAGRTGRLSGMGGVVEVSGDRLGLRGATGLWNDEPLPRLSVTIQGISELFGGPDAVGVLGARAGALPGLGPLLAILRGEPDEPDDAGPPIRARLHFERLEHPILRWPVTDAAVRVEHSGPATRLSFERGFWAGAPFDGDAIFMGDGDDELVVSVRVRARAEVASEADVHGPPAGAAPDDLPWAVGRFEIAGLGSASLPVAALAGRFSVTGTRLDLAGLRAELVPTGELAASLVLELDDPEQVGTDLRFDLVDGDVDRLGRMIGLPEGYATGRVRLDGRLHGPIRPKTPLIASLTGRIRLDARKGEIRRDELPLVVALAQASAGYNDYAARDAVAFDSIRAELSLDDGRVATRDFELDGPLRVYASGIIDTVRPPHEVAAVVGLFLFRSAGQIMETIPLVKAFLPGSEKGLMGAYFEITGPFDGPRVRALKGRSVEEDLPDVLAAPYQILRSILGGGRSREPEAPSLPAAPDPAAAPEPEPLP